MVKNRYYYVAMGMADYILEGHNIKETAKEYRVCAGTVRNHIDILFTKCPEKYNKVMEQIHGKG